MDAIISSISDSSWWFTIISSAVVAILLPKIASHTPKAIKKLLRNLIARRQRKIKNARFNQSLVNYQIAKANSHFLIFVIISCLYSAWLISGSLLAIVKSSPSLGGSAELTNLYRRNILVNKRRPCKIAG